MHHETSYGPLPCVTHLDLPTHQEHGGRGANGGSVECLQMVDDISDGVYALEDRNSCERAKEKIRGWIWILLSHCTAIKNIDWW